MGSGALKIDHRNQKSSERTKEKQQTIRLTYVRIHLCPRESQPLSCPHSNPSAAELPVCFYCTPKAESHVWLKYLCASPFSSVSPSKGNPFKGNSTTGTRVLFIPLKIRSAPQMACMPTKVWFLFHTESKDQGQVLQFDKNKINLKMLEMCGLLVPSSTATTIYKSF